MDAEQLLKSLPRYNHLQVIVVCCVAFTCFRWPWQLFGITYIADIPRDFHCKIPTNQSEIYNSTQCTLTNYVTNETTECKEWEYVDLSPKASIIVDWNLACSKLPILEQTVYMLGQMFGALFLSHLSDRFGRRPVLLLALFIHLCLSVVLAFSVNFYMFMAVRCVMGCFNQVAITCSFVLIAEWNSMRWRTFATNSNTMFWVLGIIAMPGIAYIVPSWRLLTFAYSTVPGLSVFIFYFILPESMFFLIANGRYKEVERLLSRVNWPKTTNKSEHPTMEMVRNASTIDLSSQQHLKKEAKRSMRDAIRKVVTSPRMLIYSLTLFWLSFTSSCVYYVTTINTASLSGDKYLNFALSGAVELPFTIATMFLCPIVPRTLLIAGLYLITFVCLLTYSMVPTEVIFAFFGRGALSGCYIVQVLYATEMFPTIIRNAGVGFYQVGENLGFVIGPMLPSLPFSPSGFSSLYFALSIVAGFNCIAVSLMPESRGYELPETVSDVENRPAFGLWRFLFCFGATNKPKVEEEKEEEEKQTENDGKKDKMITEF